ncbi:carbonic anhydrase (plasmid) [Skermanella rosea]|uniref:carbonic anhydrase n=1 Tax=Skermanella rosea TaxID=1817965 RepID=UPI001932E67F|nr:carbonic anhydrase [Skermanella rosea]UEM06964.1 carbonic anhydrase [Skermanella rosea]
MPESAPLTRRTLLRHLTAGGLAACPICTGIAWAGEPAHGNASPHWSYGGVDGPEHWGELTPEFRSCSLGLEQTPIDIDGAIRAEAGQLDINFSKVPVTVVNNGHTVQANCGPGCHSIIGGTRYDLAQFHFHHPSEHLLSGKPFQMECHFVHKSAAGAIAVVGVFITPGSANPALKPLWDVMPTKAGGEAFSAGAIDPAGLLPETRSYFRYAGSLTTPPCSEGVTWTVFATPIEASTSQIAQFAALFMNNARPVQGRNRRFLLESF